ncbi:MAG TPA: hypothetical protein PKY82_00430 [Pyrinomonadaceae bacterium]|nr:hypothetical protein [Pyrinomonadaceae bacterium]
MQLNLFGEINDSGTVYKPVYTEDIGEEDFGKSLVSKAQRLILKQNPFAFMFRDKTLEEIEAIHKSKSSYYYKRSNTPEGSHRLSEWYWAMWAGQTIALEKAYCEVDERFLENQEGEFYLEDKKGKKTLVKFVFTPDNFGKERRTTLPVPHLEFKADVPTEFSETGYLSHFLQFIPFGQVQDFDDFLIQILRHHLKVTSNIIFENKDYGFIETPKTSGTKIEVQLFCNECGETNFKMEEDCPSCGISLIRIQPR